MGQGGGAAGSGPTAVAYEDFMKTLARILKKAKKEGTMSVLNLYLVDYVALLKRARAGVQGSKKLDEIVEITQELGRQLNRPVWVCFRPLTEKGYFIMWPWDAYSEKKPGHSPAEALILVVDLTEQALIQEENQVQLFLADPQDIKKARRAYEAGGVQVDGVQLMKESTYWKANMYALSLDAKGKREREISSPLEKLGPR
jgi:hypothetical protein